MQDQHETLACHRSAGGDFDPLCSSSSDIFAQCPLCFILCGSVSTASILTTRRRTDKHLTDDQGRCMSGTPSVRYTRHAPFLIVYKPPQAISTGQESRLENCSGHRRSGRSAPLIAANNLQPLCIALDLCVPPSILVPDKSAFLSPSVPKASR